MSQIIENIYNGRDNTIDLLFTEDGESIQHSLITRIVVNLNDPDSTVIDSLVNPEAFDWDEGKVVLTFGALGLAAGGWDAEFIVYTDSNLSGVLWQPLVGFQVTAE